MPEHGSSGDAVVLGRTELTNSARIVVRARKTAPIKKTM